MFSESSNRHANLIKHAKIDPHSMETIREEEIVRKAVSLFTCFPINEMPFITIVFIFLSGNAHQPKCLQNAYPSSYQTIERLLKLTRATDEYNLIFENLVT